MTQVTSAAAEPARFLSGISGLLFDKDGTLFDFQASWGVWARTVLDELAGAISARGSPGHGDALRPVRARFHPDSAVIAGTGDEVAALLAPASAGLAGRGGCAGNWLGDRAAEAPMVEAVPLRRFSPGSDRRVSAWAWRRMTTNPSRARISAAKAALFDFVAGADSGHGAKPEPGMLLAFAAHSGSSRGRC
jgi:phosphoglycolate phosphatase